VFALVEGGCGRHASWSVVCLPPAARRPFMGGGGARKGAPFFAGGRGRGGRKMAAGAGAGGARSSATSSSCSSVSGRSYLRAGCVSAGSSAATAWAHRERGVHEVIASPLVSRSRLAPFHGAIGRRRTHEPHRLLRTQTHSCGQSRLGAAGCQGEPGAANLGDGPVGSSPLRHPAGTSSGPGPDHPGCRSRGT